MSDKRQLPQQEGWWRRKSPIGKTFTIFLIGFLVLWSMRVHYREPHQRAIEVCYPISKTYRFFAVDVYRHLAWDDINTQIKNSEKANTLFKECAVFVNKQQWLTGNNDELKSSYLRK